MEYLLGVPQTEINVSVEPCFLLELEVLFQVHMVVVTVGLGSLLSC